VSDINNWVEAFRFGMESEWKEGTCKFGGKLQIIHTIIQHVMY